MYSSWEEDRSLARVWRFRFSAGSIVVSFFHSASGLLSCNGRNSLAGRRGRGSCRGRCRFNGFQWKHRRRRLMKETWSYLEIFRIQEVDGEWGPPVHCSVFLNGRTYCGYRVCAGKTRRGNGVRFGIAVSPFKASQPDRPVVGEFNHLITIIIKGRETENSNLLRGIASMESWTQDEFRKMVTEFCCHEWNKQY